MSEPLKANQPMQAPVQKGEANAANATAQQRKVITNPREIAAIVMAQATMVNTKTGELARVIKELTDMTQQLVVAYARQAQFIERIAQRAKTLEAKPNGNETNHRAA
jgi:uncharacterized coiled-coil DUF342 family protein